MADLVIQELPVGPFRSTDCLPIIKEHWPEHPMASMKGAEFGTQFINRLWPLLEKRGVGLKEGTKPREYEMTTEAKARNKNS